MQKRKTITLAENDSVLIIRNLGDENAYDIEIVHNFSNVSEENNDEVTFYTLLLRGIADYAMNNPESLIEQGQLSFANDINLLQTIH
mgnify:FL=1|tara:strand:+ start:617 stop:877 length:261 start_codon:yes stop_codon:yes gene_type:complete